MPLTLATVLAHPDDETFGTGGTLIRAVRDGALVHSLCLTEGEKGWAGVDDKIVPRELVGPTRAKELAEAGRRMGLASVTCLRYPDGGLADVKPDHVVRDIVRWLREVRPDVAIIWGPDGGYGHPDHIAAGERALTAIELAGVQRHEPELGAHWHVKRCYRFVAQAELIDRLSTLMPAFAQYIDTLAVRPERWTRDRLGAVIDVRDVLAEKVHAMEAHQTQAPDLAMWATARAQVPEIFSEETFIREFPEPGGPPLETDLFAGLRSDGNAGRPAFAGLPENAEEGS
jgi:LmbE family N-acetylglucosaminyl deacetylase